MDQDEPGAGGLRQLGRAACRILHREIAEVLRMEDTRERLQRLGQRPVSASLEEIARLTASETARLAPIVKASGCTPEH